VDDTGEDAATDRDIAGEGALLVDVGAVDSLCKNVRRTFRGSSSRADWKRRKDCRRATVLLKALSTVQLAQLQSTPAPNARSATHRQGS
jgi:hypothetical protein